MAEKTKKFDGFLDAAKSFIKGDEAQKPKLVKWVGRHGELMAEMAELEQKQQELPHEINTLLKSGRMDDETITALAKKRALLDLVPSRMEMLEEAIGRLDQEFEEYATILERAVRKSFGLFFDRQLDAAMADLKTLGVDDETARQQALLRPDIKNIDPWRSNYFISGSSIQKAKRILWAIDSFEAGFHPDSPEAEQFKAKWCPEG